MKITKASKGKRVTFQVKAPPGSDVSVAGTFNDWNPSRHPMRDNPDSGHYKAQILLPPGRHEYKFVIDGSWELDNGNPQRVPNALGSLNSVMDVK